jgi:DNA-binding IclR family transcriptional regulator
MTVQSVDRALSLIEEVGSGPAGLVELAERTGLPLSTASRLLATLEARTAVSRDQDGRYRVGSMLAGLSGDGDLAASSIEAASHQEMAALVDLLDEAVCLSIPIGNQTLTLRQIDTPKPVQAQDWTGHRWDITGGGSGAILMATWPKIRVEPLLATLATEARQRVRREIALARKHGVSWSRGTYVDGLTSIAAPVLDSGGVGVAALLAYGPSYQFPSARGDGGVEDAVRAAAGRVTEALKG